MITVKLRYHVGLARGVFVQEGVRSADLAHMGTALAVLDPVSSTLSPGPFQHISDSQTHWTKFECIGP